MTECVQACPGGRRICEWGTTRSCVTRVLIEVVSLLADAADLNKDCESELI